MKYIISIVITALVFVYGVLVGLYQIFPFEQLRHTKHLITSNTTASHDGIWLENHCNHHVQKHAFFAQIAEDGNATNIFFGDSVVDGLWSENFFGIAYSKMASSGNVVECLDLIGSDLLALKNAGYSAYQYQRALPLF